MAILFDKAQKRKENQVTKKSVQDIVCKTVDAQELKTKIKTKLHPLFLRSMSAKHEKSVNYINKAIAGELPTMRIANRVRMDYLEYQSCLNNFVSLLENQ